MHHQREVSSLLSRASLLRNHYVFIIFPLWLTSHLRSTVVPLTQELQVPVEKFTVKMPIVRFELANPFIISQLWLTSHLRGTVFLLDTRTPGTSREIYC